MLSYILEVSLCWAAFYFLYWLLLSRETFFHFNRWYLLSTFVLSLVIPEAEWQLPQPVAESDIAVVYFQPITLGMETLEVTVTATALTPSIGVMDVLRCLYWIGVAFFALRFLVGFIQIIRFYRKSERQRRDGYELVLSKKIHAPFSFFNRLFLSKKMELNPEDQQNILRHELAHIRGGHSIDVLLLELASILFWCSPFVYLYRRSLRNVHEYIADAAVLKTTKKKQYGHLLIRQSQSGHSIAIANHFHSQLKKRILMMMRNQSKRQAMLKYLLAIPLTLTVMLVFSNADAQASLKEQTESIGKQLANLDWTAIVRPEPDEQFSSIKVEDGEIRFSTTEGITTKPDTLPLRAQSPNDGPIHFEIHYPNGDVSKFTRNKGEENGIFETIKPAQIESISVDRKNGENWIKIYLKDAALIGQSAAPVFAGCENIADPEERRKCSDKEMLMFIYKNIKYPATAREKGIQGTVYVKYKIDEKGYVSSATIEHGIGGGCDEEVLRVVNSMPRWTPAQKDGKAINLVQMLPVNYKLEGDERSAAFLPDNALRDTIVTFNPDTYEEKMEVKDWNNRKIVVVGYGGQTAVPPPPPPFKDEKSLLLLNEINDILRGYKGMNKDQRDQAMRELNKAKRKHFEKYPDHPEEAFEIILEAFRQNGINITSGTGEPGSKVEGTEIFKVVEEMPRFPGCEEVTDLTERKNCADTKMLQFIYENIKYPKEARDANVQGIVVISFVIETDGSVGNAKALRDIGAGCGDEAVRLINLMQKQGIRWIPGKQRGRKVRVQFNLPIRFKLEDAQTAVATQPKMDLPANTLQLENFKASPNPTNGLLNLYFKGEKKPTDIAVFDMSGKSIFSFQLENFNGEYSDTFDLSAFKKGILILQIRQGEKVYSEKIVLQ